MKSGSERIGMRKARNSVFRRKARKITLYHMVGNELPYRQPYRGYYISHDQSLHRD